MWKIGNSFKQGLKETALDCGEADRPTSVEGGKLLRRFSRRDRIGPIKEIHIFNNEGNSGKDVGLGKCVIQNCRRIAAVSTVILIENPNNETSESSGEACSKRCPIDSQEKP